MPQGLAIVSTSVCTLDSVCSLFVSHHLVSACRPQRGGACCFERNGREMESESCRHGRRAAVGASVLHMPTMIFEKASVLQSLSQDGAVGGSLFAYSLSTTGTWNRETALTYPCFRYTSAHFDSRIGSPQVITSHSTPPRCAGSPGIAATNYLCNTPRHGNDQRRPRLRHHPGCHRLFPSVFPPNPLSPRRELTPRPTCRRRQPDHRP